MAVLLVAGLVLACQAGSGARSAPAVEQLILTPAKLTLVMGRSWQLVVSRVGKDGSGIIPAVSYSATGGTITSGGLYTAGRTPGTFQVIATRQGSTLADTATVVITPGRSYTTSFPLTENPISEGGRWINGGAVGLDWSDISTSSGLATGHQCCASYTDATALLIGAWGADQQVTATVQATSQTDACFQEVELRLRSEISSHANSGYEISFKSSQTSEAYVIIVRWNGALGNFTKLMDEKGSQYGVKSGDVVQATMIGNLIRAYKNGVVVASATDDTFATGSPGIGFNLENGPHGCAGTNGDYGFTTFMATDTP